MPSVMELALHHAFAKFPLINFLVKYETSLQEIKKIDSNIFHIRWMPQKDLICKKKKT